MNQKLKNNLLEMAEEDQEMREKAQTKGKINREVDIKNAKKLKRIIEQYEWPGESLVGEKGANAAWLIAQHADHDLDFQKECFKLLREAVQKGEAAPSNLAYLQDRILVNEREKQLYGTQFRKKNGKLKPYPISKPESLDERRKKMNLSSFEEYKQKIMRHGSFNC